MPTWPVQRMHELRPNDVRRPHGLRTAMHRACEALTAANACREERKLRRQGDLGPEDHGKHGGENKEHDCSDHRTAMAHTLQLPSSNGNPAHGFPSPGATNAKRMATRRIIPRAPSSEGHHLTGCGAEHKAHERECCENPHDRTHQAPSPPGGIEPGCKAPKRQTTQDEV